MKQSSKKNPPLGSFEEAERFNAKRIAALAPAQRVKMVCSMNAIARRAAAWRAAWSYPAASEVEPAAPGRLSD